jgi:hypothetical protein
MLTPFAGIPNQPSTLIRLDNYLPEDPELSSTTLVFLTYDLV